jgi:serine/threonine-protein kinase
VERLVSEVFDDAAHATRERPPPSTSDARIGTTLVGRYRIEKLVGKGGMGRVYRATQLPLNRPVAVKVLSPDFQRKDPQFVRRFFLEAASAARLSHPNTITVFDYGESEAGELFIAMEYLQGRPLSRVITTEGRFSPERILHVGMQICRALREAHAKGIIHRDLKPGNILLLEEGDDGDFVKVLDFGLVKLFNPDVERAPLADAEDPEGELTKAGMFLGSPKYMSPEQIQGLALDPRTDIYALGVLMFQMATGRPPFTGASSVDVIYRHVNHPVPILSDLGVDAPPEVEDLIRACLAKRREDRFGSMGELLARMKDVHRGLTGISAAETGFAIDLAEVERSRGPRRPATDPRPPAADAREAGLHDAAAGDATGGQPGGASGPLGPPPSRGARWRALGVGVVGGALALALGTVAFLLARPGNEPPSAPGAPARVFVALESDPPGAEVFHEGVRLGRAPTEAAFPPDPTGRRVERFVFRAPGYADKTVAARVGTEDARVRATLEPVEASMMPRVDENAADEEPASSTPDPYKENPY